MCRILRPSSISPHQHRAYAFCASVGTGVERNDREAPSSPGGPRNSVRGLGQFDFAFGNRASSALGGGIRA